MLATFLCPWLKSHWGGESFLFTGKTLTSILLLNLLTNSAVWIHPSILLPLFQLEFCKHVRLTVWILNISGPYATNKTHNNDLFKGGMCIIRKQHVKTCARPFKTEKNIQVWHSKIRKGESTVPSVRVIMAPLHVYQCTGHICLAERVLFIQRCHALQTGPDLLST